MGERIIHHNNVEYIVDEATRIAFIYEVVDYHKTFVMAATANLSDDRICQLIDEQKKREASL